VVHGIVVQSSLIVPGDTDGDALPRSAGEFTDGAARIVFVTDADYVWLRALYKL
jgi:hypothetical protein